MNVVRDYFDVLWDRAERILDSGERAGDCDRRLRKAERELAASVADSTDGLA